MSEQSSTVDEVADRPHVWLQSVSFSDGTQLTLGRDEVVVLVGPNNAGKSVALREIHGLLTAGIASPRAVITEAQFGVEGTADQLERWLERIGTINSDGNLRIPLIGNVGRGTGSVLGRVNHNGLQGVSMLMTIHLNTMERLTAARSVELANFTTSAPTHPLHRLYLDDGLEALLDGIFKRAFGKSLVVNRGAGKVVALHVGDRPTPPVNGDRQSMQYIAAVNAMPAVQDQGDGIRAFVGIVASVLAAERDVVFIDEPEAFLHPPQAATLGRVLGEQTPKQRQLVVATHSTDFLRGILDHSSPRVRVVRIVREGDINRVAELSPDDVKRVWSDPLLRYSKVLDGLFHDGVIVCEGDADCRFYGAMMEATFGKEAHPDIQLVHTAGKSRIASVVRSLRAIGVPVRVVADFDILAEESTLRNTVESLGGDWSQFSTRWKTIHSSVSQRRAELQTSDARADLDAILRAESTSVSPSAVARIKAVLKKASAWEEAKRIGKAFLPKGTVTREYEALAGDLRSLGLYLVEVGELEGFCPTIQEHGPAWVVAVMERDLEKDDELATARHFARSIASGW